MSVIFSVLNLFLANSANSFCLQSKKGAKIRKRYNQAPHLTQDTNGKVTTLQLDITNESQEVSPFPVGDSKATKNRRAHTYLPIFFLLILEQQHEIPNNVVHVCVTCKVSDQPALTRSLTRAFASRLNIL